MDPLLLAGLAIVAVGALAVAGGSRHRGPWGLVLDPARGEAVVAPLLRASPGIYVSQDRRFIALLPEDARPLRLTVGGRRMEAYLLAKIGGVYGYVDPVQGVSLALRGTGEEYRLGEVDRVVAELYRRKLLPARVPVRPDVEIVVYLDARSLASLAMGFYERSAESSLAGVGALTGLLLEFENVVKSLVELARQETMKTVGKWVAIGVALMLVILALSAAPSLLQGLAGG